MYKFEISADSPEELTQKMQDFANELRSFTTPVDKPQYVDDVSGVTIFPRKLMDQVTIASPPMTPHLPADPPMDPTHPFPYAPPVQLAPAPVQEPVFAPFINPAIAAATAVAQSFIAKDVDAKGRPYDSRIHSSSRALTKEGVWKYRRNVDENFVRQIETAYNGGVVHSAPPVPQAAPALPVHAPDTKMQQDPVTGQNVYPPLSATVNQVATPAAPKYENVPIPEGTRPAHSLQTFKNNLMMLVAQLIPQGKITKEYLGQLCAYFQVENLWEILASEVKCVELYNTFGKLGLITMVD